MGFLAVIWPFQLGTGPMLTLRALLTARKSAVVPLASGSVCYSITVLLVLEAVFRAWTPFGDSTGVCAVAVFVSVAVEQAVL